MSSDRREFLQHLTLGGLAAGALPTALSASTAAAVSTETAGRSGLAAEFAGLEEAAVAPAFDLTWTEKLTGKYRAVFDTPVIDGGSGVWRAGLWRRHYADMFQAKPAELSPVIVIRHDAIPLAMNEAFWETYEVARKRKVIHPMTEKPTRRNPVLMTVEADELPPGLAALALRQQMEQGTVVLACNMAFTAMVSLVAKKDKLDFAEARTKAIGFLVPGVILQPNGIFGVTVAQQHGCAFVQAA